MKRWTKLSLGLAAVLVVLGLFLLPVVPITVAVTSCKGSVIPGCVPLTESIPASTTYAYLGIGAVQFTNPVSWGHVYCLVYGNPGTMCGFPMQRMNQMMTP